MKTNDSESEPHDLAGIDQKFEEYFRNGDPPQDSIRLWQLAQQVSITDALRALFHGPSSLVRLRLWVFIELMALPQAHIDRDELNRHFHQIRPDPLELVVKRFRDVGLLQWGVGTQQYTVTSLAQQVMAILAPLARASDEDADLAGMLASVAGAQQLGVLEPAQLQHLQAQLARLHDEFADAITSGSEFLLRQARRRFDRALSLVDRASQALTAIITGAQGQSRLERLARELGLAQAKLLSMASQFNRALQQADRQRVTLGSTGVTTTDLKRWLQDLNGSAALAELATGAALKAVAPPFVSAHELLDVTEGEFERDRARLETEVLPPAQAAAQGRLEGLAMPLELATLVETLTIWAADDLQGERDIAQAVLGGRFAQAAYRAQLMPLLGDPKAKTLQGATGDLARSPWRASWSATMRDCDDDQVCRLSMGVLSLGKLAAAEVPTPPSEIPPH